MATWKKLAFDDDVVKKDLFNAYTVLAADTDNTPAALTVNASTIVGRKATGGIVALTKEDVLTILNVEDGADVTDATNVSAAGALMESDIVGAGDLIVGVAEDTAGILSIGTAGQVLKVNSSATALEWAEGTSGDGDFKADGSVPMTGDLDFAGNAAKDMTIQNVANESAVTSYASPVVAKMLYALSEGTLHICTDAS